MHRPVLVRGTGSIGLRHLHVLQTLPDVTPLAWPVRPERRDRLAADGLTVVTGEVPPTAGGRAGAIIATDTGRHVSDGLLALDAGWDLLVEKPVAPDAKTAHPLAERARRLGRQVYVAAPLRFADGLRACRDLLPSIGNVHAVRIECQSYLPAWRPERDYRQSYAARAEEGGVLRDLIHEIDYAGWLFGWPDAIYARFQDGSRLGIASETGADLLWTTPTGASVSVRLDYLSRTARRQLRINGDAGDLIWDALAQTVSRRSPGSPDLDRTCRQDRDHLLAAQSQAFLAAVAGADPAGLATLQDGLRALAVCDAARVSARTGRLTPIVSGGKA